MENQPVKKQGTGRYVVLDGAPGSGIATQLELLAQSLRSKGYKVKIFVDHGNDAQTRAEILRAEQEGYICLRKRFELSRPIQDFYSSDTQADYRIVNDSMHGIDAPKPDFIIILDAPSSVLEKRIQKRNSTDEPVISLEKLDRIRTGYLWEAKQRGYHVVYTDQTPETIHKHIWELLKGPAFTPPPQEAPPVFGEPVSIKEVIASKSAVIQEKMLETKQTIATNDTSKDMLAATESIHIASPQNFFIPSSLTLTARQKYIDTLNDILKYHHQITATLTDYLITTDILAKNNDSPDVREAFKSQALQITESLVPVALTHTTDKNLTRLDTSLQDVLAIKLKSGFGTVDSDVTLASYWPHNEFDLLPHILYPNTNMSLESIKSSIDTWKYEDKLNFLKQCLKDSVGNSDAPLEHVRYAFDMQTEYGVMSDLLKQKYHIIFQQLTPRYGFGVPEIIERAGLTEDYESCFDKSAELFSTLQAEKLYEEAQYATLTGHRVRFTLYASARDLKRLISEKKLSQTLSVLRHIKDKTTEVHPLLSDYYLH